MSFNRRQFLGSTLASSVASGLFPLGGPAVHAAAPGKKYRTALIGSGWWGMNILQEAVKAGNTKVVALCDVDEGQLESSGDQLSEWTTDEPKLYKDFRELLAKEQIEIAIIATPDHWHALQGIAAVEAGAHVFVEKPTGHTVKESRAMVNAARQADSVVQVGMHRRSGPHHVSGMEFLKSGKVGKIGMVRMFVHGGGGPEAPTPNSEIPKGLDWDMYCGPAPLRPFNRRIHPGGFRNFLDFANGQLGDWGVHWLDQMLWWSEEQHPKHVYSTGGRPIKGESVSNEKEQTTDAPDSQVAVYEFENFTATWEHRQFASTSEEKHRIGCYFYGQNGTFHMGWRDGWTFYPSDSKQPNVHVDPQFDNEKDGHNVTPLWADFIRCIESKKRPVADIETGHLATNLSLLGMLSYKLGRGFAWDGSTESIPGDTEAQAMLRREYRGEWKYPEVT